MMKTEVKVKQFFALLLMSMFTFLILCLTGCGGGKSCEGIGCGSECNDNVNLMGLSIPGCGGILSSGKGCGFDTCGLWSQSIKGIVGTVGDNKGTSLFVGVDNNYYVTKGRGCCNSSNHLNSCHALAMLGGGNYFISLGKHNRELYLGCVDGSCGFCFGNGPGSKVIKQAEMLVF